MADFINNWLGIPYWICCGDQHLGCAAFIIVTIKNESKQ